jgi:hypothetical protein
MRKLLDWIAAKLGYVTRDYPRINNGADAMARGERWEAFYREEGGLADMILSLRRDYFEKVGSLKPGDMEALQSLGMADRIAREIDAKVREVIDTGKIARSNAEHANKIASIRR